MKSHRAVARVLEVGLVGLTGYLVVRSLRRRRLGLQFFKSVTVRAGADSAYDYLSRLENFPECFPHIRSVRRTGYENEWRWTLEDNEGATVEWNAWITESIPGKAIAWESAPGSPVKSAGVIQLTDLGNGSTRLDVRLSYIPASGRAARALMGALGPSPRESFERGLDKLQARFDEDEIGVESIT
jgi:uncharacterized membrane protein